MAGPTFHRGFGAGYRIEGNGVEMAPDAVVFAMANPVPEIMPDLAKAGGARVVGTGARISPTRSITCWLSGISGALDVRAKEINREMRLAASHAIAALVGDGS
jgi:malate dehydrogenase (oxaloacetate-decarboxylating)